MPHIKIIKRKHWQCGAAHLDVSTALRSAQHDGKKKNAQHDEQGVGVFIRHPETCLFARLTKDPAARRTTYNAAPAHIQYIIQKNF